MIQCNIPQSSKTYIIFVSFETLKPPNEITTFINGRRKDPSALHTDVLASLSPEKRVYSLRRPFPCIASWAGEASPISLYPLRPELTTQSGILIIIDTLHPLLSQGDSTSIIHFLLPLISQPGLKTSLLAIYHDDIPVNPAQSSPSYAPYAPSPVQALNHLATTILTVHSLPQHLSRHLAKERSLPEPVFGLAESREGVLLGISPKHPVLKEQAGFVLEMEHRRKSGRGMNETFVLPLDPTSKDLRLLEDHPAFKNPATSKADEGEDAGEDFGGVTFDLSLTEKQRREREGVVLPYFDAQKRGRGEIDAEEGARGDGGRILYQMGREDDFDEEEDEI